MAAEARYPSRRRSSRQTSQLQQTTTEEKPTYSAPSPRATRARSNAAQGEDTKPLSVNEPSVVTRHSSQIKVDQPLTTQSPSPIGSGSDLLQNKEEVLPEPVNEAIVEYVREDKKEVLWYATPPINIAPSSKPMHSTDYLYWKQQQRQKQQGS